MEKVQRGEAGYEFSTMQEVELSQELVSEYEKASRWTRKKTGTCLPWVRVQRDPQRFNDCLRAARSVGVIDSSHKIYDLIKGHMAREDQEVFYVILLDTQNMVRGVGELARGARDRVETPIPDVLRLPIVDGATAFFIAHNHPSGKARPSTADRKLTEAITKAGELYGIPLMDHIIVGSGEYYSFVANRVYKRN